MPLVGLSLLIAALIVLLKLGLQWQWRHIKTIAGQIPGERILPVVGNMMELIGVHTQAQIFQYVVDKARKFRQGYRFYAFGILHYWPIRCGEVEFIFNGSTPNEKSFMYRFLHPVLGKGILCSEASTFQHALQMAKRYGRGYCFYLMGQLHYWPIRGHELDFVFKFAKNTDKSFFYKFLDPMMGDGLLCSNGAKWAHRRKIITPAFHFNILQQFLTIFKEESDKFVIHINELNQLDDGINLQEIIPRFTLNNICETAMGVKLSTSTEADNYREMIYRSGELLLKRYINPLLYNDMVFGLTTIRRDLLKCVKVLNDFSSSVISMRRHSYRTRGKSVEDGNIYEKNRYAMLDTLLEAEADGGQIDKEGIQEEVDTFMFEGYDTTSAGILFCLFMIATHRSEQQKIFEEIAEIIRDNNGSRDLGINDYSKMKYMDRVLKEAMRLYPPVPYISRQIKEPVDLGHVVLPVDTQVHIFIYNLHRDPEQFPDPERFDVDRFLPENADQRHPFAYIPFSAGQRNCIGQKFAMLEIKTLITSILCDYRLEAITRVEDIVLISDLVLRAKDPIRIRFVKRD